MQLNREHRLYQADWLMRFYKYDVTEIIDEDNPFLDPLLDPKANWAVNHLEHFPVEVNTAPLEMLLRVPGIGPRGARLIMKARRTCCLHEPELRKLGIVYKRARFFITCNGKYAGAGVPFEQGALRAQLAAPIDGGKRGRRAAKQCDGQLNLFDAAEGQEGALASRPTPALGNTAAQSERKPSSPAQLPEKSTMAGQADGLFGWQHAIEKQKACA